MSGAGYVASAFLVLPLWLAVGAALGTTMAAPLLPPRLPFGPHPPGHAAEIVDGASHLG